MRHDARRAARAIVGMSCRFALRLRAMAGCRSISPVVLQLGKLSY
jgi:hypothetical protein